MTRGSAGPWIVLLHQTPRSWDEYALLLPHLAGYRAVVPDLPGYGRSDPAGENTIEAAAEAAVSVLDALGVDSAHLAGHHFGGLVAYHIAVSNPDRVASLALSSTPYIDADERERRRDAPPFNSVPPRPDGSHLAELWQRRRQYLAEPIDPGVITRYIRDVLAHPDPDRGHAAVAAYRSEDGLGKYRGPLLCLSSARDPRAFPHRDRILTAFPQARHVVLDEGDISSPETCPGAFAHVLMDFHRKEAAV